jgi:predicted SAM-dependent methyltransferase
MESEESMKPIRINLGCGTDLRKGYINVDSRHFDTAKHGFFSEYSIVETDIKDFLLNCPDNVAEEALINFVLEHFDLHEIPEILFLIWKTLKPDGILKGVVPDTASLSLKAKAATEDWDWEKYQFLNFQIFGEKNGTRHAAWFDEHVVRMLFDTSGFWKDLCMKRIDDQISFKVTAHKPEMNI